VSYQVILDDLVLEALADLHPAARRRCRLWPPTRASVPRRLAAVSPRT